MKETRNPRDSLAQWPRKYRAQNSEECKREGLIGEHSQEGTVARLHTQHIVVTTTCPSWTHTYIQKRENEMRRHRQEMGQERQKIAFFSKSF